MLSKKKLLSVGVVLVASTPAVFADVIISNIQLTSTTLSFDLNGTIEDPVGSELSNHLFIGETGKSGWITGTESTLATYESNVVLTDDSGEAVNLEQSVLIRDSDSLGDGIWIVTAETQAIKPFSFGSTIDGKITITGGSFLPSNTIVSNWIISAGYNSLPLPDPDTKIGGVPEPGSLALLFSGGLLVMRRRRSGRSDR